MAEKERPRKSLLGDLAKDLAEGLAHPASAPPAPAPPALPFDGPPPASAIRDSTTTQVSSPLAVERANEILAAAGLVARREARWSLVHAGGRTDVVDTITIGREPTPPVTLSVRDPMVSRRHCAVAVRDGRLLLADLGSTNGLVIRKGGARIQIEPKGRTELEVGDEVTVNDTVLLFTVAR